MLGGSVLRRRPLTIEPGGWGVSRGVESGQMGIEWGFFNALVSKNIVGTPKGIPTPNPDV